MAEDIERVLVVPLRIVKVAPRTKRANRAVSEVRQFVARHMKTDLEKVWIDTAVNEALWSRGIQKPPRRIRVKAVKFEDGVVEVSLPEEAAKAAPASAEPKSG